MKKIIIFALFLCTMAFLPQVAQAAPPDISTPSLVANDAGFRAFFVSVLHGYANEQIATLTPTDPDQKAQLKFWANVLSQQDARKGDLGILLGYCCNERASTNNGGNIDFGQVGANNLSWRFDIAVQCRDYINNQLSTINLIAQAKYR